jgi:hypothetical protein
VTGAGRHAAGHAIASPSVARNKAFRLASPVSPKYDAAQWRALLSDGANLPADRRLVSTVEWLADEWRTFSQGLRLPVDLGGGLSRETLFAVACANRDYADAHRSAGGSGVFSDNALNQPIKLNDYNDALGDSLGQWLFDASRTAAWEKSGPWPSDLDGIAEERIHRFSRKHALFDFFQQSLWEGWAIRGARDSRRPAVWTPDQQDFAKLTFAWNLRTRASPGSDPSRISKRWAGMTRAQRLGADLPATVVEVRRDADDSWKIEVGTPPATSAPLYFGWSCILADTYLAGFVDRPLPNRPDLNCRQLLKAWSVLETLAEKASATMCVDTFRGVKEVRLWALAFSKRQIQTVLERALGDVPASLIVDFLTWRPELQRGLWGSPLVAVPDEDSVCLVRPLLTGSYVLRRSEIWLDQGGFSDSQGNVKRGLAFEQRVRDAVAEAIRQNAVPTDARCAPRAINQKADGSEEIDLVLQLGGLLIVGDVKCFLFPADSRERYRYMRDLKAGAEQASRKARWLASNPEAAAHALGIAVERAASLRPIPIVVVNHGFGAGSQFGACRIVEAKYLETYLSKGDSRTWPDALRPALYTDQDQAEESFERSMAEPPALADYLERLVPTSYVFPTATTRAGLAISYYDMDEP